MAFKIDTFSRDDLESLQDKYGENFYIFDAQRFRDNYEKIREEFTKYYGNFQIAYSYKTNYLPKCCQIVSELGGYAEVVSSMELEIAHKSNVDNKNIIWNGPVKDYDVVETFLISGGVLNIDNIDEWKIVETIAKKNNNQSLQVGVRCNFDVGDGVLSRFGIDVDSRDFLDLLEGISNKKNIELFCIQCHFAKRNPAFWKQRTQRMIELYSFIRDNYGISVKRIDLGGGLSGEMQDDFAKQLGYEGVHIEDYARNSAYLMAKFFEKQNNKPMLVIEPGTALVADCMKAVFRVENIRCIRGKWIATVNGSQKNISMYGLNPPIRIINMGENTTYYDDIDFAGYTCIESDYLYKGYTGDVAKGDYLVLDYCGSYSLVYKPPFIYPNIPIVEIDGDVGNSKLLKRRELAEDILNTYFV